MNNPIHRLKPRRGGFSLVYAIVMMTVLIGFVSLGVDWALVECSKTELQSAVDAAARAGANGLLTNSSQAVTDATTYAAKNKCNGTAVAVTSSDIDVGTWNSSTRTFNVGGSRPNAVRVNGQRSTARGTAIPLTFAAIFGRSSCDIHASGIATIILGGYGVVGLNSIAMSGNSSDSYWSSSGYSSGGQYGSIASNGNITLSGNSSIHGDAHPGIGKTVSGGTVSGSTSPLTTTLSYPNGNAGSYATTNSNGQITPPLNGPRDLNIGVGKTYTFPGGTYYIHDFSLAGTASLTFTGPTTIYCYHNFTMSGSTTTASSTPGNLNIIMCPDGTGNAPGPVNIGGSSALYAHIYAPQSAVTLSGSGDIYGSVLGLSVNMTGTSAIHYDLSLPGANGTVSLVK